MKKADFVNMVHGNAHFGVVLGSNKGINWRKIESDTDTGKNTANRVHIHFELNGEDVKNVELYLGINFDGYHDIFKSVKTWKDYTTRGSGAVYQRYANVTIDELKAFISAFMKADSKKQSADSKSADSKSADSKKQSADSKKQSADSKKRTKRAAVKKEAV